jgi:hypothetical protein
MNSRSHENFAKLMYPHMTFKQIQKINSIVDSPSKKSKLFADSMNFLQTVEPRTKGKGKRYSNRFDVFNLGQGAVHRRVNHDPVTASIMGLLEYGPSALPAIQLHLMLDAISDNMKKDFGRSGRDLREAQMNYVLESMVRRGGRLLR